MKIPDRVQVGPYIYRVDRPEGMFYSDDHRPLNGDIDYDSGTIRIWAGIAPDRAYSVFWHEVTHALAELTDTALSEEDVSRLGPAIAAFLLDNAIVSPEPE